MAAASPSLCLVAFALCGVGVDDGRALGDGAVLGAAVGPRPVEVGFGAADGVGGGGAALSGPPRD